MDGFRLVGDLEVGLETRSPFQESLGGASVSQDVYLEGNELQKFEMGWVAGARVRVPVSRSVLALMDVRYLSSLTNAYVFSSSELYYRDVQTLVGLGVQF